MVPEVQVGLLPVPGPSPDMASSWWDAILDFEKDLWKPVVALVLVAVAMAMAHAQHLGITKDMAVSITRAFVQLSLVGFLLNFIFSQSGWEGGLLIFLAFCSMVTIAGYTAGQRAKGIPNAAHIAGCSIFVGCSCTMVLLLSLQIFEPSPRYLIPIAGMMVGNSMNATAVALKRLREDLRENIPLIEAALALGATPRQAVQMQVKRALTLALTPTLDSTKTMGIISLPGAMTGLIMGGASPFEATRLQIVIMNMLIGASTISCMLAVFLAWPQFFTSAYQIIPECLQ